MIVCANELLGIFQQKEWVHLYGYRGNFFIQEGAHGIREVSFGAIAALEKRGLLRRQFGSGDGYMVFTFVRPQ